MHEMAWGGEVSLRKVLQSSRAAFRGLDPGVISWLC